MKDPIKIIHKFKNNNRRIQYKTYIFVGPLVDSNILDILSIIEKKDFYNSLITLNKKNLKLIENYYGIKWYTLFFNNYHINKQIDIIKKNINKKKKIILKLGKDWYTNNIEKIVKKNIEFSFASNYYTYLFNRNKIKTKTRKKDMDFRTYIDKMKGGNDDKETNYNEDIDKKIEEEDQEIDLEDLDEEIIEDFDIEELTNLYSIKDNETSKEIKETSKLISEAINDKKWEKKIDTTELTYDTSLDDIPYDSKLEDIYLKYYIFDQYIFKDDTIKIMREKITVSLSLNTIFGKENRLLPEFQYFWSEYYTNNNLDRVMLGQKWIRRNELLNIDIKPNENLKVYENLRNNLGYLKDSFGFKIKREDDEMNILRDYDEYSTNNEIYMIDILNDIGVNYKSSSDEKKNLYDVYVNIYFPLITMERFQSIVQLLNGNYEKESLYNQTLYTNIKNDMKLESTIYTTVEEAKLDLKKYDKLYKTNHIIQSIIHVDISNNKNITGTVSKEKYNLYRIFEGFIVNNKYPFIQLQTISGQITYKLYLENDKINNQKNMTKWFENAPYGLTFKIKVNKEDTNSDDKYISINLHENGRMDYKITWKEDDKATVEDIKKSYKYINELLQKINLENKKIKIILPDDNRFKYAFINTIRKFNIPNKFKINHNDLSEFCRFFYPYISLVIEPKKRESKKYSKTNVTSKYGTYLRYKRVSKYENRTKMHLRILYFLRNFEISNKVLIDEISKQFNITAEDAAKELDYVKDKYGKAIKRSSKVLKKLKSLPKGKPPGIDLAIQGRDIDRYKIRIAGARSKEQLEEISSFMKVLIFLYIETYLFKKSKYQKLKDILNKLTKIAKRRNKVNDFVDYQSAVKDVKAITALDKKRLAFKPEKGQNQWTRSCQNSGNDKRRRPIIVPGDNIEKLIKMGYKFNKKTNFYEKEVTIEIKGKKSKVNLRAIKQFTVGDTSKFNFYTCDPSTNGKHSFIGFLSRGNNPDDLALPCCFKKDQLTSNNKKKVNLYKKSIGILSADNKIEKIANKDIGDKLYILQDTNKIQEGRFIYLKKHLNTFFNKIWGNTNTIKNHYLTESKTGYYFKYTVKDNNFNFLAAISNIYDKSIDELKNLCINALNNDKKDLIYKYLNNGDISTAFGDKKNFFNYIKTSNYLEYEILGELLSVPNVLSKKSIYYYIIESKEKIVKTNFEKEVRKEKFYLSCLNLENKYKINDDNEYIILIKEGKYYFPIYRVKKDNDVDKKIILQKKYEKEDSTINVLNELNKYYDTSCNSQAIYNINEFSGYENKTIINILQMNKINIKYQLIDSRNKSKFLVLDKILLPTNPTGISYKIPYLNYDDKSSKYFKNLKTTIALIEKINKIIKLDYIPKTVFYSEYKNDIIKVESLLLKNNLIIPLKKEKLNTKKINKLGINYRFMPLEETIDKEINNNKNTYNTRTKRYKEQIYYNEGYNLFRLELSSFLNKNTNLKNTLIGLVRNDNMKLNTKKYEIRKILFSIIDSKLSKKIKPMLKLKSFSKIVKDIGNLKNYNIVNIRDVCDINKNKNNCNNKLHCIWTNNKCMMKLTDNMAIDYINKILVDFIENDIRFKEIIQENDYYVSDIVNYELFTNRPNQKIIKTSNFNIKKIMSELFGKDNIPSIGKRNIKNNLVELDDEEYEIIELGDQLIQEIISNNDSIIRAYTNCYYWINNPLYNKESRNLGYQSSLQTQIVYILKAKIIDFIQNNQNNNKFSELKEKFYDKKNFFKSAINKFRKTNINSDGSIELLVLSYLFPIPIVVYDNFSKVIHIYLQGKIQVNDKNIKRFTKNDKLNSTIFLKFYFEGNRKNPNKIYSIYYV